MTEYDLIEPTELEEIIDDSPQGIPHDLKLGLVFCLVALVGAICIHFFA